MRQHHEGYSNKPKTGFHKQLFLKGNLDFHLGTGHEFEKVHDLIFFNKTVFRPNNKKKENVFLSTLVEFGCESLLPHFYLPYYASKNKDFHKIVIGWPGRSLFYEHYADEFWSIDPKYSYLRAYTKAFSGMSKNIKAIEASLKLFGHVVPSANLNKYFCEGVCKNCKKSFINVKKIVECEHCGSTEVINSILADTDYHKLRYRSLYVNFGKYSDLLKDVCKSKNIAVFARNRVTYGRNLPADFYRNFCSKLENKGYNIFWLGEKVSALPCPSKSYFDFTKSEFADDIHACLALVSQCKGTFQAWTASTRFAQAVNIPYVLVESFDQIFGFGQEGKRIKLLTPDMKTKKIIFSNYKTVIKDLNYFADLCFEHFIDFIENKNYIDVVGAMESKEYYENLLKENDLWKLI
jgi:hypothetical protein